MIEHNITSGISSCQKCTAGYGMQGTFKEFEVRLFVFTMVHDGLNCAEYAPMCDHIRYEPLADRLTCLGCGETVTVTRGKRAQQWLTDHQTCQPTAVPTAVPALALGGVS